MATFTITDAEWDRLGGLPHLSYLVYFVLRRHMDFRTGHVGVSRRIALRAIAEELEIEPHPGIASGKPSGKSIRHALDWLERIGLLQRDKAANAAALQLVCWLPYAQTDHSVRKQVGTKWAEQVGSKWTEKECNIDNGLGPCTVLEVGTGSPPEVGTHPISDIVGESETPLPPASGHTVDLSSPLATAQNPFEAFWAAWPSGYKIGRKAAQAKWRSLRLDALAQTIIADVQRRQQEDRGWRDGFIPNPLTYLNQARWQDDIRPAKSPASAANRRSGQTATTNYTEGHDETRPLRSAVSRVADSEQRYLERQHQRTATPDASVVDSQCERLEW